MKKDNKGFSLVELIVVIAIMAVLMVVLTPALLRYVEKARLQNDNTTISEVANAAKIACASEAINKEVAAATSGVTIEFPTPGSSGNVTVADSSKLQSELAATIGAVKLTSNTYTKAANAPTITVKVDSKMTVTVTINNQILEVPTT